MKQKHSSTTKGQSQAKSLPLAHWPASPDKCTMGNKY